MKKNKKYMILFIMIIIAMSLLSCAVQEEEVSTKEKVGKANKSLSMKLSMEQGVIAGQVFLKDDIATARIIMDNDLEESKIQEIAQKYIEILRENYQGKNISVQGVQNNKDIVDLFIEK